MSWLTEWSDENFEDEISLRKGECNTLEILNDSRVNYLGAESEFINKMWV